MNSARGHPQFIFVTQLPRIRNWTLEFSVLVEVNHSNTNHIIFICNSYISTRIDVLTLVGHPKGHPLEYYPKMLFFCFSMSDRCFDTGNDYRKRSPTRIQAERISNLVTYFQTRISTLDIQLTQVYHSGSTRNFFITRHNSLSAVRFRGVDPLFSIETW